MVLPNNLQGREAVRSDSCGIPIAGSDHRTCPGLPWITGPLGPPMKERGFTLIEMIIVISIVTILTSIAIPVYRLHVLHAREAVLKEDLFSIRQCIDQYTQDKNKAPQALDDLVSTGYLHALPKDPFTESNQTWEPVMDDSIQQLGQSEPGIVDVHSGSKLTATDGTAYNTW